MLSASDSLEDCCQDKKRTGEEEVGFVLLGIVGSPIAVGLRSLWNFFLDAYSTVLIVRGTQDLAAENGCSSL